MVEMETEYQSALLREAIIQAWDCVIKGSGAVYLSGPITTGRRYIQKMRSGLSHNEAVRRVKQSNIADLLTAAIHLRATRKEIVIEPGSLHFPNWSQAEYHLLWERLIREHVRLAVFMPDWEYSLGCAIEFAHAYNNGIKMETLSGARMHATDAIQLLKAARDDILKDDVGGALRDHANRLSEIIANFPAAGEGITAATRDNYRKD